MQEFSSHLNLSTFTQERFSRYQAEAERETLLAQAKRKQKQPFFSRFFRSSSRQPLLMKEPVANEA